MATAMEAFSADEKLSSARQSSCWNAYKRRQDRAEHGDDDDKNAKSGGDAGVHARAPIPAGRGCRPKNAALSTTPDISAPDAPLPAP